MRHEVRARLQLPDDEQEPLSYSKFMSAMDELGIEVLHLDDPMSFARDEDEG